MRLIITAASGRHDIEQVTGLAVSSDRVLIWADAAGAQHRREPEDYVNIQVLMDGRDVAALQAGRKES